MKYQTSRVKYLVSGGNHQVAHLGTESKEFANLTDTDTW